MESKIKRILASILVVGILASGIGAGVYALFSDTETSNGNLFTAGTLDLTVNGLNGANAQIFNVANMKPGNQPTGHWNLQNIGSLAGTLSISSITVTNNENGITEPETEAGDVTASVGELGAVVSIDIYIDADKDGYYSVGDTHLYQGTINGLPSTLAIGALGAGATTRINAVVNWWSNSPPYDGVTPYHIADDNLAQGDSCTIDFTFSLVQS
jgi:spore coat-associated protein N